MTSGGGGGAEAGTARFAKAVGLCHPQLLFHHHMDRETLKSLFGDLLKAQEDRLVCLLCLCSCFRVR